MRLLPAVLLGAAATAGCAVVLGDYPIGGSVPWLAALIIPALIGSVMTFVAGAHRSRLWMATGPLALAAMGWGVRIASGWGLDPVPAAWWAAMGLALVWPVAWGLVLVRRDRAGRRVGRSRRSPDPVPAATQAPVTAGPAGSVDG